MFNNREIATAIWVLLFAVWALSKTEVRNSAGYVVRAFIHPKILVCLSLMTAYIAIILAILALIGVWHIGLTKATILWLCFSGFALVLAFANSNRDDNDNVFRKIFFDNFKAVILVEFLINTYTLSLVGELVVVLFVTFVILLDTFARTDDQYAQVARITGVLLVVTGFSFFAYAVSEAIGDYRTLRSLETLRSISLPPLLSITLAPFIYAVVLVSTYELVFLRLKLGPKKTTAVLRYARRRILLRFGLRVKILRAFLRLHALDLMSVQTVNDVDNLVSGANQ